MDAWHRELKITLSLLLLVIVAGSLTGWLAPLLYAMLFGLIVWQLIQFNRFRTWLNQGARGKYPPVAKGIWEDVYYHVYLLKKREKRRKKKLGKIIDQFRKSTDALPDAAVVLGQHDEIEWANSTAKTLLSLQTTDRGQRLPNLIRYPVFVRYLNEGNYNTSITIPSPADPQISLSVRVIEYGAGLRLLLAQDVTQLKKVEQMRKDFVANVSHELRTPLTVLKGYLETLQDSGEGVSPLLSHSFKQMLEQTERMQYLVDDLLLLSNLETQPRKSKCVDIPALLSKICQENATVSVGAERINLKLDTNAHIKGDEQELHSAFSNLLSNALKYSPSGSPVTLSWSEESTGLILAVTDQGEGIPENEIPRITERFYRIDAKRPEKIPGTGLGLAIVKHVLIRHDAKLQIVSQLNKGSTFKCQFPLARKC
jgi:two-component system, OmpR family, phosphate regulon sensor histidine kinase PhoR